MWSGKPDSNRRPQPWQGCALPTELFPQTRHSNTESRIHNIKVSLLSKGYIWPYFNLAPRLTPANDTQDLF